MSASTFTYQNRNLYIVRYTISFVMVKINRSKQGNHVYISLYQGNKFLKRLGREDNISPEKILYEKRKMKEQIKKTKEDRI